MNPPVPRRPNALWVLCDQLRAQALGYRGDTMRARFNEYGPCLILIDELVAYARQPHDHLPASRGQAGGQRCLTAGKHALVQKKKGKYKLLDFTDRGDDEKLGMSEEDRPDACPTVDALHRLLWLVEHKPPKTPDFLNEAKPNVDQLRLVAQALAGPALKCLPAATRAAQAGGELADVSPTAEQSALGRLLANRNAVMAGKEAMADKRAGQQQLL